LADSCSNSRTDTAPCVGCGLCCDGTIYWRADAQPGEEERLTDAGLEVIKEGDKQWFVHPCCFSKDGLCTIYDQQRFNVCHTFRCKLLKAYQRGEVSLEQTRETVEKAVALRTELTAENPAARLWTERNKLRRELETTRERPSLLLKIAVLDYYLDQWFRE